MHGSKIKVRAYSSSANLGSGFDTIGVALDLFYDEIMLEISEDNHVKVNQIYGPYASEIDPNNNTAVYAIKNLLSILGINVGVKISLWKGIPPGKGLGSSGASAAAAVKALSELLNKPIPVSILIRAAGQSEAIVSGVPHYDNVASSLIGGFTIIAEIDDQLVYHSLNREAWFSVGLPEISSPKKKTFEMRRIIPQRIPLNDHVKNSQRLALLLTGLFNNDLKLVGLGMRDLIVEPYRSKVIPCYNKLKETAYAHGALGFTISGAGPSVIALAKDRGTAESVSKAFTETYEECGVKGKGYTAKTANGASRI